MLVFALPAQAQSPEVVMENYLRAVDQINQRHNDAVEAIVRQIRDQEAKGQPVAALKTRLSDLEEERVKDIQSADARLQDEKEKIAATKTTELKGATPNPSNSGGARSLIGTNGGSNAYRPALGARTPDSRAEVIVDGSSFSPVIDFTPGQAPVAPAPGVPATNGGVEEINF